MRDQTPNNPLAHPERGRVTRSILQNSYNPSPFPTAVVVEWDTLHPPFFQPIMTCPQSNHIPLSVAVVPGLSELSPTSEGIVMAPSVHLCSCRIPSRHLVMSRNEGRKVGSICGQEEFPVRTAGSQASLRALSSKGSSLPLLSVQAWLLVLPLLRWEAHIAAVQSELKEGHRATDFYHAAECVDIQAVILCQ